MNLKSEASSVAERLEMPTGRDLLPYLEKLLAHPGSAIIIGIERVHGELRVGHAWLNPAERSSLRAAIQRVNAARRKKGERLTSEPEPETPAS